MLVQARYFAFAMVVMFLLVVMANFGLHSFYGFLFQQGNAVDHAELFSPRFNGRKDGLHPGVGLAAQIDEQVAVPHRQDIRRRRLVRMTLGPRRQQQRHIRQFSRSGPGKVIGRKHRGHDL